MPAGRKSGVPVSAACVGGRVASVAVWSISPPAGTIPCVLKAGEQVGILAAEPARGASCDGKAKTEPAQQHLAGDRHPSSTHPLRSSLPRSETLAGGRSFSTASRRLRNRERSARSRLRREARPPGCMARASASKAGCARKGQAGRFAAAAPTRASGSRGSCRDRPRRTATSRPRRPLRLRCAASSAAGNGVSKRCGPPARMVRPFGMAPRASARRAARLWADAFDAESRRALAHAEMNHHMRLQRPRRGAE